ncbi:MAG: hypothetical protein JAY90_18495 [Candidatus Thiodiazotropha lotti]|nr:hypothetical protein [Candidatus Thiodiazotropha lotti]
MHDLHNNARSMRVISPVACGVTGTGLTGEVIDTQGYNGVELIVNYGAVTATDATITVSVLAGDTTGALTSVADANLLGTETLASLPAASTRTSGTSMNVSKRVGYNGSSRYITLKEVPTVTAAALISATAILHSPNVAPTPNP